MLDNQIFCISYFDQIMGPNLLFCSQSPLDDPDHPNIRKILEINEEEGAFIFAFRKYQTINYLFDIKSNFARGGSENIMITYMIRSAYFKNEITDIFKYLESKIPLLEEYASKLQDLDELPIILHSNRKPKNQEDIIALGSEQFKEDFLKLFNLYLDKISTKYTSSRLISKKIFVFGDREVGKSTFLKNIEDIQFHNQNNRDLPTRIYEIVIDNIEILTFDCIERDFTCEMCNNYGGCISNAQGFILMFNASDKQSFVKAKNKFEIIVKKCSEIENEITPVLIIGNTFNDGVEISPDFVTEAFDIKNAKECGMKIKYYQINIVKEINKIIVALRWLVRHMV